MIHRSNDQSDLNKFRTMVITKKTRMRKALRGHGDRLCWLIRLMTDYAISPNFCCALARDCLGPGVERTHKRSHPIITHHKGAELHNLRLGPVPLHFVVERLVKLASV